MSSVGIWKFRSELNDLNVQNYFFIMTIIPVRVEGIPSSSLNSDGLWSNSDRFRSDAHKFQMIFVDYDRRINDPDELVITTNSVSWLNHKCPIAPPPPPPPRTVMLTFFEREIAWCWQLLTEGGLGDFKFAEVIWACERSLFRGQYTLYVTCAVYTVHYTVYTAQVTSKKKELC